MGEDLPDCSGEPSEWILNECLAYLLHWFLKIRQQELAWFHLYQSVADLLDETEFVVDTTDSEGLEDVLELEKIQQEQPGKNLFLIQKQKSDVLWMY